MNRWLVSDWHLGDDRFVLLNRPFLSIDDMIRTFVVNHNNLVEKTDEVYFLGDICYQHNPSYLNYVDKFNGRKILVRGNHDRVFDNDSLKKYFVEIVDEGKGIELDIHNIPCFLTHYPKASKIDKFNIVGHIHNAWRIQTNMFNCGVDVNNWSPTSFNKIPKIYEAIKKFYDEDVFAAYFDTNQIYSNDLKKSYLNSIT